MESKATALVKQNPFGYWVGCVRYGPAKVSEVTNAQYTADRALEIAQRIADAANAISERQSRFKPCYH